MIEGGNSVMQNNPPAKRATNPIWLRRASIALVVLMIGVFGTELTLARLRGREVTISLSVLAASGANAGTPVPVAGLLTPVAPATAAVTESALGLTKTPMPAIVTIAPADQLIATVNWHYTIGPRFPHTTIHITAVISGRTVADGQVKIDCGAAVLNCDGTQSIALVYTVPDLGSGVQQVAWPTGDYQLVVDRSDASLPAIHLQTMDFQVR